MLANGRLPRENFRHYLLGRITKIEVEEGARVKMGTGVGGSYACVCKVRYVPKPWTGPGQIVVESKFPGPRK